VGASFREKAKAVTRRLEATTLRAMVKEVQEDIEEMMTYYAFPDKGHRQIRTNNPLEHIVREIRWRSRIVGRFPDGQNALMLVAVRLWYIAGSRWGTRQCMNMKRLKELGQEQQEAAPVVA
jgi:putative transposase